MATRRLPAHSATSATNLCPERTALRAAHSRSLSTVCAFNHRAGRCLEVLRGCMKQSRHRVCRGRPLLAVYGPTPACPSWHPPMTSPATPSPCVMSGTAVPDLPGHSHSRLATFCAVTRPLPSHIHPQACVDLGQLDQIHGNSPRPVLNVFSSRTLYFASTRRYKREQEYFL